MRTYKGSCHCGLCRSEVGLALDHVRSCNGSVCTRRGALRMRTPLERLSAYPWHTRTAQDYFCFCPQYGILPFRIPSDPTEEETAGHGAVRGIAVNVRCLENAGLRALPVVFIDGAHLG